jgi:integrase
MPRNTLSEISRDQVVALHSRLHAAGKGVTANRVIELLRAIFNFAIREGYIESNPAESVTPVAEADRTRFLQSAELPTFLDALEKESQPWPDFFKVALYVGYRRSAVAAMRWQDVDLESSTWSVPGERSKNGEPIVLPVAGQALEILKHRYRNREENALWVFPGGGRAGHLTQPKAAWARILRSAGISDLRIHDLRRTLGSWMANAGVPLQQIGRVLGHKDARSTQVYAHLIVETAANAVTQAHKKMSQAVVTARKERENGSGNESS